MEKGSVSTETDPQTLQDRLKDLEQQLAEAKKTIQTLTSTQDKKTLQRLELLFAQSRDIILFIRPDDGKILDANDAATRAYGYSHDELLGLTIYDLRAPDTISQIAAQMEQANSGDLLFETVHQHKDGGTFPVEVSSQSAIVGSDRTLISIIRDISGRKKIEQEREQLFLEVQQQKERFSKAFQASPEALVISRLVDGRIVEINESFERLFGYSREEVIGKTSLELDMFANPPDRLEAIERMREQGSLRGFDLSIRTRIGEERPASLSIEMININHEDHLLTILHDLTERKRLEGAIRKERDRAAWLARLPDENPSPVVRAAANGIVLYHNPAAAILPEWACAVNQSLPEPLLDLVIRAIAQGQEVEQDVQLGERYYLVSVMPIPDEAYANLYGRDITDRKQAERALQESETRYRRLIENANEGIWTIDTDHLTDFINQRGAHILGYTVEEMLGKPALDFVFPEDISSSGQQLADRKQGIGAVNDFRMRHKEGHTVWVRSSSTPIFGADGEYLGALAMFIDITERRQAEQALRESEQKYRTFFNHLYETVSIFEAVRNEQGEIIDWVYLDVNQAAFHLLGRPLDQVVGKPVSQVLGAEVLTRYMAEYRRVLETGEPSYHEAYYQDQTFLVSVSRMDENRVASIGLDISERKRAEEALRESEEMLRLALTAGRAGAWTWDLTTDTLHWSDEYYRIFGFEPGSIRPSAESGFSRVLPDDLSRIEGAVRQAVERGTPIDEVHRVIWPDGSVHWVRGISRAFYTEPGKPDRMAGIAIDITEQKVAEIELQAAHRRNSEILESIHDAFYSLDWAGHFTYVNRRAASLWGKQPEELLGKNIWEVFPSGKETESYRKIQQALADRQPDQYESYSSFLDQWIEVHLYPSQGGISVYFQDISKRKRAEAALAELSGKLERSNRELEEFAFVASHDLQEPLRKIEAFGDSLLQSTEQLDDRARLYVDRMRNAVGRMRGMVDGLLQLSRINTQGQPFIRVELSKVAAEVLSDLEHQVQRTGGRVEISALPVIEGDPMQLRQLLQNLIGNAIKYHRPDTPPVVKVHARQLPGRVQILVEDKGIGFDQSEAEKIFQPFQRLVGRSQYEGSGMGLAICRRIVERHGGEITAHGEADIGSIFVITFPAKEGMVEEG